MDVCLDTVVDFDVDTVVDFGGGGLPGWLHKERLHGC